MIRLKHTGDFREGQLQHTDEFREDPMWQVQMCASLLEKKRPSPLPFFKRDGRSLHISKREAKQKKRRDLPFFKERQRPSLHIEHTERLFFFFLGTITTSFVFLFTKRCTFPSPLLKRNFLFPCEQKRDRPFLLLFFLVHKRRDTFALLLEKERLLFLLPWHERVTHPLPLFLRETHLLFTSSKEIETDMPSPLPKEIPLSNERHVLLALYKKRCTVLAHLGKKEAFPILELTKRKTVPTHLKQKRRRSSLFVKKQTQNQRERDLLSSKRDILNKAQRDFIFLFQKRDTRLSWLKPHHHATTTTSSPLAPPPPPPPLSSLSASSP